MGLQSGLGADKKWVGKKILFDIVEQAWLWYSFPEVQIRNEAEIGLVWPRLPPERSSYPQR